jgi:protocatechuate 3,4-dioxygenase beta subunit
MFDRRKFIGSSFLLATLSNIKIGFARTLAFCVATTRDVLGPFYKSNSPIREAMADAQELGQALSVSGIVYDTTCEPLNGAIVELWQANAEGVYDNTNNFKLRAQQTTSQDGAYLFTTVYPGSYDNRPSHIHYRVSVPGGTSLVTQLYFEGDPLIPSDPFAGIPSAKERIKPVDMSDTIWKVKFDIYLGNVNALQSEQEQTGYLKLIGSNPFEETLDLSWSVYESGHTDLLVYDIQGKLIETLWSGHSVPDKRTTTWNAPMGLQAGTYIVKLMSNKKPIAQLKIVKK